MNEYGIMSFKYWNESDLQNMLVKAYLYLNFRCLFTDPGLILKQLVRRLRHPLSIVANLKGMILKRNNVNNN
ncbi:MAG: hypothetical protein C3F06_07920 [Candidatus Methanoperedenaceae archaeon]|nr:MAG: hypothetical protein C3F06_07920 [Candidatus Methanoperedenaceae archaeon]